MKEAIARVIEYTFQTKWALVTPPAPAVKYQNAPFVQPASGEWVALTILPGSSSQTTMGLQRVAREFGVVMFQIFEPKDTGTRQAKKVADIIARQFRFMQWWLKENGDAMQTTNGVVIRLGDAGALQTEAGDILNTEDGLDLESEDAPNRPLLVITFREPEIIDVGERRDFYQLNCRIPYVADQLFT